MRALGLLRGAFIASLFLSIISTSYADNRADRWYQVGHQYSQMGRNDDAFKWMIKAADAGHAAAQNNIGVSYLHGLGVDVDKKTAFEWFEKSAEQGYTYAQSELAMLYYNGEVVDKDVGKAQKWWLTAAELGDEYAQFNLASLYLEQDNIEKAYYWFNQAHKNNHKGAKLALDKLNEIYIEK